MKAAKRTKKQERKKRNDLILKIKIINLFTVVLYHHHVFILLINFFIQLYLNIKNIPEKLRPNPKNRPIIIL